MKLRSLGARMIVAATLLAAMTAGAAAPAGATSPAPKCTTGGLLVWIPHGFGNGTAGSIYYQLEFTNLSAHTCKLQGFPRVTAVGLDGKAIGKAAAKESSKSPLVTLSKGASAVARLRIVEAGAISPSACHPTTAGGLRVRPPGQTASRLVPLGFEACASGDSVLSVGAVHSTEHP